VHAVNFFATLFIRLSLLPGRLGSPRQTLFLQTAW